MLNTETVHRRARRVLPEVIQTSGVLLGSDSEPALASLLLPLRRKPSGVVVFRLSEGTLRNLQGDALGWLRDATRAREALFRFGEPFDYRPWRALQLQCGRAYFTAKRDGRASILLLPEEGTAIYAWRDCP